MQYLIEAEIEGMRGSEVRTYEVTVGLWVETFAPSSAMQRSWRSFEEARRLESPSLGVSSGLVVGDRTATWSVLSDGYYIGHFADREHFMEFLTHYMRGRIIEEIEV